jgi:adenylosuccinate synthase
VPPPAWIILGLGYGDEGKGRLVDALTRRSGARVNVRFNGGPQAAHHVVTTDGRQHCFSQLGAGSLVPGVETFWSHHCFLDPLALLLELQALGRIGVTDAARRLTIDPDCPLVTPWHGLLNRIQERARGRAAHGTCGRGAGVLFAELAAHPGAVLRAGDLRRGGHLIRRLRQTRERLLALAEPIAAQHRDDASVQQWLGQMRTPWLPRLVARRCLWLLSGDGPWLAGRDWLRARAGAGLILEGAQGALLDMDLGDWPHVTPSRTTAANALALLDDLGFAGARIRLGVTRAYATRHGPGPLVSEVPGLAARLPEAHNRDAGWQGPMRAGWLDLVAIRRAIAASQGIEQLAVTCLDRLAGCPSAAFCDGYRSASPNWGPLETLLTRDRNGIIQDLQPPVDLSSGARTALTRLLTGCRPRLQPLITDPARCAALIGERAGVPVTCLAVGPTAPETLWADGTRFSRAGPRQSAGK